MASVKENQAAIASFTITLGSLASSSSGVGRQSSIIDNTSNLYLGAYISVAIKLGTSPNNNSLVTIYLIRDDNNSTAILDDGAGVTDAGLTIINATPIMALSSGSSASTGQVLKGVTYVPNLSPKFGIAVVNNTGVALDSTNGNHVVSYIGLTQTIT